MVRGGSAWATAGPGGGGAWHGRCAAARPHDGRVDGGSAPCGSGESSAPQWQLAHIRRMVCTPLPPRGGGGGGLVGARPVAPLSQRRARPKAPRGYLTPLSTAHQGRPCGGFAPGFCTPPGIDPAISRVLSACPTAGPITTVRGRGGGGGGGLTIPTDRPWGVQQNGPMRLRPKAGVRHRAVAVSAGQCTALGGGRAHACGRMRSCVVVVSWTTRRPPAPPSPCGRWRRDRASGLCRAEDVCGRVKVSGTEGSGAGGWRVYAHVPGTRH